MNIFSVNLRGYYVNKVFKQSLYKPQNAMQTEGIIVPLIFCFKLGNQKTACKLNKMKNKARCYKNEVFILWKTEITHIMDICFLTQNRLLSKMHKLPCRPQKSSK